MVTVKVSLGFRFGLPVWRFYARQYSSLFFKVGLLVKFVLNNFLMISIDFLLSLFTPLYFMNACNFGRIEIRPK